MLIRQKPSYENNECHTLEREEVSSKTSLCFIVMDDYSDGCSSDQWPHIKIKNLSPILS